MASRVSVSTIKSYGSICCTVTYAPYIGALGLDMARKCTREKALSRVYHDKSVNHPTPLYPESLSYYICISYNTPCDDSRGRVAPEL